MSNINDSYMRDEQPAHKNSVVQNAHPCGCKGIPAGETTGPSMVVGNVQRSLHLHPFPNGVVSTNPFAAVANGVFTFVNAKAESTPVEVTSFSEGQLIAV